MAGVFALSGGISAFVGGFPGPDISEVSTTANRQVASERMEAVGAERSEPVDVLLLGIDKRPEDISEEIGVRSDAIMVARVMPDTGEIRVLSVPRDLYLEIEPGEKDRINSAYAIGGVDQTRSIVERYTGVGIEHYAVVDFDGFEEAVDAIGGVRVDVREGEYPDNWQNIEPGMQKLNGKRALIYARYRDSAGGDLDRIGHQQQILTAVKQKATSLDTVTKLPELVEIGNRNIESDLGTRDGLELARGIISAQRDKTSEVESFQLKGQGSYLEDGRQVLAPDDEENRKIIADFLRG